MKPKVSVVIPMYNAEATILKCLQSLYAQNYKDIEIIVVDDGSTDHSPELVSSFEGKFAIKLVRTGNFGPGHARNIGVDHITGKYALFVDADDHLEPDVVSHVVEIGERKNADLVICNYFEQNLGANDRKQVFLTDNNYSLSNNDLANKCLNYLSKPYKVKDFAYTWAKLFKVELLKKKVCRYPLNMTTAEDVKFLFKYLKHCKNIVYSKIPLLTHNIHIDYKSLTYQIDPKNGVAGFFAFHRVLPDAKSLLVKMCDKSRIRQAFAQYYINFMIIQIIRIKGLGRKESSKYNDNYIEKFVRSRRTKAFLKKYKRGDNESMVLPILLRLKFVKLFLGVASFKGIRRYNGK